MPLLSFFSLSQDSPLWQKALTVAAVIVCAALAAWLLAFISARVFKAIGRRQKGIHLAFFERLVKALIVIGVFVVAISVLDSGSSVWKTILGGTAVISAVAAFAAQDVIKDVLAGLMISLQKPFEIGDRIRLEDGTYGVVQDMTNRHVVLAGMDTIRYIVPNSRINAMMLTNYCFHRNCRSASFKFSVGYDTDIALAKRVIAEAVMHCPETIPGKEDAEGTPCYAEVYFTSLDSSSLTLQTTVYYEPSVPTERVIDSVNTAVRDALNKNGIEIPYNYINVVDAGGR